MLTVTNVFISKFSTFPVHIILLPLNLLFLFLFLCAHSISANSLIPDVVLILVLKYFQLEKVGMYSNP